MNFLELQSISRRKSWALLILFLFSAVILAAVLYPVLIMCLFGLKGIVSIVGHTSPTPYTDLWHWSHFWVTFAVTLLAIIVTSVAKIVELDSIGNRYIPELFGGRLLLRRDSSQDELRLLNVVDELSLASGTGVPSVYILPFKGLNAFISGTSPNLFSLAITEGLLKTLERSELQAVVAHEFSHLLNGDTRLNTRLSGMLHGILIIHLLGEQLYQATIEAHEASLSTESSRTQSNLTFLHPIILLATCISTLGETGVLLSRVIKNALLRQREFLADAGAVQLTRDQEALVSALTKIGSSEFGSTLRHSYAESYCHFFFADALAPAGFGLFRTHPSVDERLIRLGADRVQSQAEIETPSKEPVMPANNTLEQPLNLNDKFGSFPQDIPATLVDISSDPDLVDKLIISILATISTNPEERNLDFVVAAYNPAEFEQFKRIFDLSQGLSDPHKITIFQLCLPTLTHTPRKIRAQLLNQVTRLAEVSPSTKLNSFCLRYLLLSQLQKNSQEGTLEIAQIAPEAIYLLSLCSRLGEKTEVSRVAAFNIGIQELGFKISLKAFSEDTVVTEARFAKCLDSAKQLAPPEKIKMVSAMLAAAYHDRKLDPLEAKILRLTSLCLEVPIPAWVLN